MSGLASSDPLILSLSKEEVGGGTTGRFPTKWYGHSLARPLRGGVAPEISKTRQEPSVTVDLQDVLSAARPHRRRPIRIVQELEQATGEKVGPADRDNEAGFAFLDGVACAAHIGGHNRTARRPCLSQDP